MCLWKRNKDRWTCCMCLDHSMLVYVRSLCVYKNVCACGMFLGHEMLVEHHTNVCLKMWSCVRHAPRPRTILRLGQQSCFMFFLSEGGSAAQTPAPLSRPGGLQDWRNTFHQIQQKFMHHENNPSDTTIILDKHTHYICVYMYIIYVFAKCVCCIWRIVFRYA